MAARKEDVRKMRLGRKRANMGEEKKPDFLGRVSVTPWNVSPVGRTIIIVVLFYKPVA